MGKNQVSSFINQFIATVKGDDAKAQAEKNWRKANSALKSAIPSSEGDTIRYEDELETAKENLKKARVNNGNDIINPGAYVTGILQATQAVEEAEENLQLHLKKVKILNEELAMLSEEVELVQ